MKLLSLVHKCVIMLFPCIFLTNFFLLRISAIEADLTNNEEKKVLHNFIMLIIVQILLILVSLSVLTIEEV